MILSPFEHFVEKSGETVFQKLLLSTTFLMSKLLKYISQRRIPRSAATSKMECFVIIVNGFQPITISQSTPSWMLPAVNYYHKALHLGCCSSPRSASVSFIKYINFLVVLSRFLQKCCCLHVFFISNSILGVNGRVA